MLAYYLTDGLTREVLANLANSLLTHLHDNSINVCVLVCDGCGGNQSMLSTLGVRISYPLTTSFFPHPADGSKKVYVLLGNSHMLKLVRIVLAQYKSVRNGITGGIISWDFLQKLHNLQQDERLRLANKLKRNHLEFASQKMKVNLSVQTLSNSTAQALLCLKDLGYPEFQDCDEIVNFSQTMDRLFDIMYSRNPFGKGFKGPLRLENKHIWLPFLNKAHEWYLTNLQTTEGVFHYHTKRKTPILGYLPMIRVVKSLFEELVEKDAPLKYILTYKFSQDYLELSFSAARALNGRNNNPTFKQFKAAYRRLLNLHDNTIVSGNCTAQDNTVILSTTAEACINNDQDSRKHQ